MLNSDSKEGSVLVMFRTSSTLIVEWEFTWEVNDFIRIPAKTSHQQIYYRASLFHTWCWLIPESAQPIPIVCSNRLLGNLLLYVFVLYLMLNSTWKCKHMPYPMTLLAKTMKQQDMVPFESWTKIYINRCQTISLYELWSKAIQGRLISSL